jgi:hypothetical protein
VAFQKKNFAFNVQAEWVAFTSTNEVTVTADGLGRETPKVYNLNRVGSNNNTPTKGYESGTKFRAGTILEGSAHFRAWYEPRAETNGANDDETIMFDWD